MERVPRKEEAGSLNLQTGTGCPGLLDEKTLDVPVSDSGVFVSLLSSCWAEPGFNDELMLSVCV